MAITLYVLEHYLLYDLSFYNTKKWLYLKGNCGSKCSTFFLSFEFKITAAENQKQTKRRKGKVVNFKERLLFSLHWVPLFFLPSTAEQRPPLVSQWVPVSRRWLFKGFVHKSRQFGASWFPQRLNNNYRLCNSFLCQGIHNVLSDSDLTKLKTLNQAHFKPLITLLWNSLNQVLGFARFASSCQTLVLTWCAPWEAVFVCL